MIKSELRAILISILFLVGNIGLVYAQEAVGKIVALEGKAEVQSEHSEEWRALNLKDDIYTKDTIKTGEESRVGVFFIDESNISIGPQTTVSVEKLIYSPAKNYREGKVKVLMGKTRFNVGRLFSKESTFEVHTPTAVAGVKGTSFIVWVTDEQLTQLLGISGSVVVRNILPSIEGESLLRKGFVIYVPDGEPPGDPVPITFDELLDFLKDLGPVDGDDDRGPATGGVTGNTLFRNLRGIIPPTGQTNIVDQPVITEEGDLPEPPAPPPEPPEDNVR
jgi:hypothetical protein